jgi:Domain of unknown function (DUF4158)
VATRVFADDELERLRGFPEINKEELIRQTRTGHLQEVTRYLTWKPAKELQLKELDEFLLARAMEHDSPSLLFRLACEYLAASRMVRPGVISLLERVAAARAEAGRETYQRAWLAMGATGDSANAVKGELEKLAFLRGLDGHALGVDPLHPEVWR